MILKEEIYNQLQNTAELFPGIHKAAEKLL